MRAPLCDLDKTKQGDPKSCDCSCWLLFTATSKRVATQTSTHTNKPTFLSLSLVSGKEVDGEAFAALEGQRLIQAIQAFSRARLCCDGFPFWFSSISSVGGSSLFEGTPHRIVLFLLAFLQNKKGVPSNKDTSPSFNPQHSGWVGILLPGNKTAFKLFHSPFGQDTISKRVLLVLSQRFCLKG